MREKVTAHIKLGFDHIEEREREREREREERGEREKRGRIYRGN